MRNRSSIKKAIFLLVLVPLGLTALAYAVLTGGISIPSLSFTYPSMANSPDRIATRITKQLIRKQGDPAKVPPLVRGDSRQQLQKLLGSPCGQARHGDSHKLYYEAGAILLKDGLVLEVPHDFVQKNLKLRLQTQVKDEMQIRGWLHFEGRWMREGEVQIIKARRQELRSPKKRKQSHRCRTAEHHVRPQVEKNKKKKPNREFTLTSFDHGMKKKRK